MNLLKRHMALGVALSAGILASSLAFGEGGLLEPLGLSLTVGVRQTDNRDKIPDGFLVKDEPIEKEDDTEIWVSPKISFDKRTSERFKYYFEYSPSYTYFDNPRSGGEEEEWSHMAKGDIEFNITPLTIFRLTDLYIWSGAKDWYYDADYELGERELEAREDDYWENLLRPSILTQLTADDTFKLSGLWRVKRYDEEYAADRGDEDEYSVLGELMHRQDRHVAFGLFGEYTAFDRTRDGAEADPLSTDGSPLRIDAGVQYVTLGVQLSYDFLGDGNHVLLGRTGYNFMWYEADDLEDDDMWGDTRIEFAFRQLERTSGRVGIRYGNEYADVFPYSSQENMTLYGNVARRFGRTGNFALSADVEYRMRTYEKDDIDPDAFNHDYYREAFEDKDADRDSIWVRVSAAYEFTEDLTASVFYSYEDVDSDIDTGYTENVVGVTATYDFL